MTDGYDLADSDGRFVVKIAPAALRSLFERCRGR